MKSVAEQIQGFYNTAEAAKGSVVLKEHPAEANINSVLAGIIDDVHAGLNDGHNVYSFSPTRRDADIIAEEFSHEKPLSYNAYTKGSQRADDLLRNQKLTDSRLFVGTSAAGVGISILDEKSNDDCRKRTRLRFPESEYERPRIHARPRTSRYPFSL